jgi:hypothetical protein
MEPELRREFRAIITWGVAVFLVVNAFSWHPGYGGRTDRKPGMEVERYFGWPACFYCDLWRSDRPHKVNGLSYVSAIPLSSEMYFVYFSSSALALLLDVGVAACAVVLCLLLAAAERRNKVTTWMTLLGVGIAVIGLLIIVLGDAVSAYL